MVSKLVASSKKIFTDPQMTVMSAATVVMLMVLASRVLGLVRQRILADYFIPSDLSYFFAAFRLPDLLFEVLVFGTFSSAFIPVFTKELKEGHEKAWSLAAKVVNIGLFLFGCVAIIFAIFAVQIYHVITPGFSDSEIEQIAQIARILFAAQGFFVVSYVLTGVLESLRRFLVPALAPIFYNLGIIVGTVSLTPRFGLLAPAIGVVLGAALHFSIQLPLAYKMGFRFSSSMEADEGVKKIGKLALPRVIDLSFDQIGKTVELSLASGYAAYLLLLFFLYRKDQSATKVSSRQFPVARESPNYQIKKIRKLIGNWKLEIGNLLGKKHSNTTIPNHIAILVGILIGLFPFIHLTAYLMMCITLAIGFLLFGNMRKQIFIMGIVAGLIGIPQILAMGQSVRDVQLYNPGYLVEKPLTFEKLISYWWLNLGLTSIFGFIGFLLAKRKQRIILVPFLAFFVIGNLFQFSPEMASNHKFFNMFVIGLNMFTAYFLYRLWKIHWSTKALVPILLIPLTLTGIIDVFPIVNDRFIVIPDIATNTVAQFIVYHTPPNATFLNSSFLYTPESLAGRKIFLGWPYFSWSAGYNTDIRGKDLTRFFLSRSKKEQCDILTHYNMDYFTTEPIKGDRDLPDIDIDYFRKTFISIYSSDRFSIYPTKGNCI